MRRTGDEYVREIVLVSAAVLTVLAPGAWTAESDSRNDKQAVETVIVTATRLEKPLSEIGRSIAVVGRDEIESIQPQSVPQVLAFEPNINISGGPRASTQSVNIRGLQGNKVLQTVDGARQSFESGHRPSYFLDPELLRSVEAVRGPSSSLWGSGAVGGLVAQNTITAKDVLSDEDAFGGFIKTGYDDNNDGSTSTGLLAGASGSVSGLISGYYRDSDDIELGNGDTLLGSGSNSQGGLAKLNWQLTDRQALELIYRHADWDGSVPTNATAAADDSSNFLIDRKQTTDNVNLAYSFDGDSELVNVEALAYANRVKMDETRKSDGRDDATKLDVLGFNVSNLSEFGSVQLMYGIDSYREKFNADRGGQDRPVPPDAETTVWGAYVLASMPLVTDWNLELGVRYDDFETDVSDLNSNTSDSATSPSAAIVWDAVDWLLLSVRYDRAFRAPGAEELYSTGFHFCISPGFCNGFLPNPDLEPEKASNIEMSAKMAFADIAGADVIHVEMSVFENKVDNFIEQIVVGPFFLPVMDGGYTTWVNVDEATLTGGEISAAYLRGGLSFRASYGLVRGEDDDTNEDITNIPADTLKLDLAYKFSSLNLMTGVRYTYADNQNRTQYEENTSDTTYDSYGVTDLYASWSPESMSNLRFDLNVNNLEDKYYRRAWEELYEAGREVVVSARYQF
ncbi:Heme/hemopexin utilization protein C [Halioglobus japonicus]|nr:Heme/hemopexin utilization protein C [Halioglobus japonicus]